MDLDGRLRRGVGTAAEWVVVPSEQAVDLPDGASDALGACLGIPAMTAHLTLHGDGPLHGRTVLVAGGAGAVGHYAIELGKAAGATVVTTVSGSEKATHAKAAGADLVVNYRDPDAARQILDGVGPVDRIVEVALRDNLELDLAVAAPGATVVTYAAPAEDPSLPVLRLMWSHLTLRFTLFHTAPRDTLLHAADALTAALGEGALTPLPLHTFGLDEVAAAHEAVEHGVLGKAVLDLR